MPWSVRTREATRRAGLDGPVCAPCYGSRTGPSTTRTGPSLRTRPLCDRGLRPQLTGSVAVGSCKREMSNGGHAIKLSGVRVARSLEVNHRAIGGYVPTKDRHRAAPPRTDSGCRAYARQPDLRRAGAAPSVASRCDDAGSVNCSVQAKAAAVNAVPHSVSARNGGGAVAHRAPTPTGMSCRGPTSRQARGAGCRRVAALALRTRTPLTCLPGIVPSGEDPA
jgi:hypothetical protein